MHVGLIDVDSKIPNLALMKLSAWHKAHGDTVRLMKPEDVLLGQNLFEKCDLYYGACVFEDYADLAMRLSYIGVKIGGTGVSKYIESYGHLCETYNLYKELSSNIENMKPDYDLYGIDYGMGFLSRGCIRNCQFCIVPRKEGAIRDVAWPDEVANPKSKELILLDNNFLASPLWREKSQQIIDRGYKVDFTQGLDIRLVDQEKAKYLATMKHRKRIHFAFDHICIESDVRAGIELLLKEGIHHDRLSFYILVNFNSTIEQDLKRIAILDEYGVNSFVMIYNKAGAPQTIKHLARWCNKYQTKKSCRFEDYNPSGKRTTA